MHITGLFGGIAFFFPNDQSGILFFSHETTLSHFIKTKALSSAVGKYTKKNIESNNHKDYSLYIPHAILFALS